MASGSEPPPSSSTAPHRRAASQPTSRSTAAPKDNFNNKSCRDFSLGKCRYGEKCRFQHVLPIRAPQQMTTDSENNSGGISAETQKPAVLGAALNDGDGGGLNKSRYVIAYKYLSASAVILDLKPKAQRSGLQSHTNHAVTGKLEDANLATNADSATMTPRLVTTLFKLLDINLPGSKNDVVSEQEEVAHAREMKRLNIEQECLVTAQKHKAETQARLAWEAERGKRRLEVEAKKLQAAQEAIRRQEARAKEEASRQARLAEQDSLRLEMEAAATTQHIVLGSTLVTFGAGLEVRSLVSGFESCRLTIRNLPSNAKPQEIAELFTQQGMNRDDVHILSIHPIIDDRLEAKILTSAAQGVLIATGLNGIEFRDERLQFEVSEILSADAMDESSRQTDTLTVTFFAPSITMIASYSSMDLAREHQQIMDKKIVGGRRIKADMNRPPTGPSLRYYNPASVKITGIPVQTTVETIMDMAGTLSVRAIKSNSYDLQDLLRDLRLHLDSLPDNRMSSFDRAPDKKIEGIVIIKVRFENWEDANNARASLEGKHLRHDYPILRLFLPPPLHFTRTISIEQYEAQRRLWDSLAQSSADKGARVHIDRVPARGIATIRLSGDDKKLVGALKVRVETLAAGEKLKATHWHRSFLRPQGREFLAKVFSSTKVYVRSDFKTQSLKIFGEGEAKEKAHLMIEKEAARLAEQEWTVFLKRQSVGYFVRKGLAALKDILGDDSVVLDLASTPCKVTIRGGEEARHALNNVMDQALNDLDFCSSDSNDICPICYDAVSNPAVLGCKHVYCTACIRHYLTSASETKIFPLACMGDEAKCKVPISIPIIQRFLIPQQYEHLVNVAFSVHLDRHPQDFRYCTTPDCTQIYRANTRMMLKCPSCFAEVCSSCHEEAHEGMSCEDRQNQKVQQEEQLNNQWATSHGVKRCPSCTVYIEKIEGCNHMTCRCGAHICWICVAVFPAHEIYPHLGTVHGGAFNGGDGERHNLDLQHALALQHQVERNNAQLRQEEVQRILREQRERQDQVVRAQVVRAQVLAAQRLREQQAQRQREEYQRQFNERQERTMKELTERRRAKRQICIIM